MEKLLRDPSLRNNERGKGMLRLLHVNAIGVEQLPEVAAAVPPHCARIVVQLARQYAKMWYEFATELDRRARIIDPLLSEYHVVVRPHGLNPELRHHLRGICGRSPRSIQGNRHKRYVARVALRGPAARRRLGPMSDMSPA